MRVHKIHKDHYMFEVAVNPYHRHGEISVLFCGEGRPLELHNNGPGIHDYYLMHTVISGRGYFSLNGKGYNCGAGDTFLIFPGALYQYVADEREPWHYVWAAFQGHRCEPLLHQLGWSLARPVMHGADKKTISLYRKLRRTLHRPARAALAAAAAAVGDEPRVALGIDGAVVQGRRIRHRSALPVSRHGKRRGGSALRSRRTVQLRHP